MAELLACPNKLFWPWSQGRTSSTSFVTLWMSRFYKWWLMQLTHSCLTFTTVASLSRGLIPHCSQISRSRDWRMERSLRCLSKPCQWKKAFGIIKLRHQQLRTTRQNRRYGLGTLLMALCQAIRHCRCLFLHLPVATDATWYMANNRISLQFHNQTQLAVWLSLDQLP